MKKTISIIFGFLFLIQVALFSQEIISSIEITRAEVQTTAGDYLKLSRWKPEDIEVTKEEHTFTSWYTMNKNPTYKPNFTPKFPSYEGERSIKNSTGYDVMPYVFSGFDHPNLFRKAVTYPIEQAGMKNTKNVINEDTGTWLPEKYLPSVPGGVSTKAYFRNDLNEQKANKLRRQYLAGIDCVGFVMKAWGMLQTLHCTGLSASKFSVVVPKNEWHNLKTGDYFVKFGHLRLFARTTSDQIITYEASPEGRKVGAFPGVYAQGYSKLSTHKTWEKYMALSPFPYFNIVPDKENGPTSFRVTVQAGAKLVGHNLKRGNQDISLFNNCTPTNYRHTTPKAYNATWTHQAVDKTITIADSHWQDVVGSGGKLKSVTYTLSAKNEFYHKPQGSTAEISPSQPSGKSYFYSFDDTTNFTFYKYAGTLPPAVRAVVIVNEANIIVGKYQFVRKSDGSYQHVADNVLPFGSSTEKYTFYVAFDKKANGAKIYTGSFNRKSDDKWFDRVGTSGATPVYRRDTLNLVDSNPEAYIQDCAETGLFWI